MMIAGDRICLAERTSRNFKSRRNTERDTTSTSNDNPGLQEKLGLPRKIVIDQHNGHGLGVFRIITAAKVRLMDPELKKTTIAKGPDRSSNMTEEYAR